LKEVVSVGSSEDGFVALKAQSCTASAIAMLEASPGKANFPASSSKSASTVVVQQQELPAAPDQGQGISKKIIQSSGEVISATMQAGPNGFALAFFPGTIDGIETEPPNLTLEKIQKSKVKKKSATPVKKRPSAKAKAKASKKQKAKAKAKASKKKKKECTESAGASEQSSESLPPESAAGLESAAADADQPNHAGGQNEHVSPSRTYRREYYKAGTSRKYAQLSIRQGFGKKSVVVHLSLKHLSQKEGKKIVAESLALLKEGNSEEYVYTYAKDKAAAAVAQTATLEDEEKPIAT